MNQQTHEHVRKALFNHHFSITTGQRSVCVLLLGPLAAMSWRPEALFIQIQECFASNYFVFLYYLYLSTSAFLRNLHTAYSIHLYSEFVFKGKDKIKNTTF